MRLKLGTHDTIIATYAQPACGPGWANEPLYLIVRDGDGKLREECLQPREQGRDVRLLYDTASAVHSAMLAAVAVVYGRVK